MLRPRALLPSAALVALAVTATPVIGAGPSFKPDATFTGSTLAGWRPIGDATWKATNGAITGTPTQPGGGYLLLDKAYQDVGVFASFKCTGGCKPGIVIRAEAAAGGGFKGVLLSLAQGDVATYAVTVDAQGHETSRERLRNAGGQIRIAPPVDPNAPARGGGGAGGPARAGGPAGPGAPAGGRAAGPGGAGPGAGRGGPSVALPVTVTPSAMKPGDWNDVEILADANIVRLIVNNAGSSGGAAEDVVGKFGPIALYVGGTGEVTFKDIAYKDLMLLTRAVEQVGPRFRKQQIGDFYYSWGQSADDFNHDGITDIVSGPHIYYGPEYTTRREIYLALTTNPSTAYSTDAWMQFSGDFTGDGWPDVINASFSGANAGITLYVNPKTESRRWDAYRVTDTQQTEVAVVSDVDGDGRPAVVYGAQQTMRYAKPDPANPTGPWIVKTISEPGTATAHGVGAGDVNGDGRVDILNAFGWWEQPAKGSAQALWTYHPVAFSRSVGTRASAGGSVMAVYDVNGDRLNDVVTSLSAHGWGLAWYEQKREASGAISFVQHMIMDDLGTKNAGDVTFSELHGSQVADVDGDGINDFIVGKRYWAHEDSHTDPNAYGDPVLYVYRTVRNAKVPGGAEFVPELVHNRSGAGSNVYAGDINKDGRMDIVSATKFGTFVFWGQPVRR